ncbi:MAG: hypothetical protein ACLP4R_29835 [Solirubrobacteraceae bacterium]
MSVLSRCFRRFAAVLVGAVLALALIALPAVAQSSTTITARLGTQFSGAVDTDPGCDTATTYLISWGDGAQSDGNFDSTNDAVDGTHTYTSPGAFSGTVSFQGGGCNVSPDTFTANVAEFTQCPPVDENGGCQFLITVSTSGETVVQDPNEGPYEGSDDSLIGVQNNSSSTIDELPLSVPGSDLFGFDGDGICDVSAPVPSGCVVLPSDTSGLTCGTGATCAFPPAPGQPAADADAYPGSTQNGYEGPTSYFTNISADTSSGVVHFSPGIPPNGSAYFSLEEPPVNTNIGVGGTSPYSPGAAPPTVTTNSAAFSAFVNPNGSSTTAYFQYGIDLRYTMAGGSGIDYTNSTSVQAIGADFANHLVTGTALGLVPNALYHFRLVATNGNGTTFGPDQTFTTGTDGAPPPPVLGKSVDVTPVSGIVFIKPPPGKSLGGAADTAALSKGQGFVPLTEARQIPTGSEIDALHGSLRVVSNTGKIGKTQTASLTGGIFKLSQDRSGISKGLTNFNLVESAFQGAPSYSLCKAKKSADEATVAALSSKTLQLLKVSGHGKFKTTGRYSSATVRGTIYTVADKCDGTLTHVIRDTVLVDDFVRHKTILLHAGQSYLAKKP